MTHSSRVMTAIPIVAVLLLAAFTSPSLGMVGVAEAKKQKVDPRGDTNAHEHFADLADLDIKSYGFDKKNAYIEVYGTAGGTIAMHEEGEAGFGHAVGYVINIVTRSGEAQTWAIDSHEAQHSTLPDRSELWHGHRVNVVGNCLNEVDHVTLAKTDGNRMIFENMKTKTKNGILGIEAKTILSAHTVLLDVQVADPDNPGDAPCIALVSHVFDSAILGKVSKD